MEVMNVVLSILLALVCVASAVGDFKLLPQIVESMERLRMPTRIIPALGIAKVAGALGLLFGLSNEALGAYAALCLTVYFLLANTLPAAVLFLVALGALVTG
jgi:hypothetical protein